jgi:two-component system, chemotaxis family, protein-glutamate methylesterase/glutaminase
VSVTVLVPPRRQKATRLIAVAASAGGLAALSRVLGSLPPTLASAVLVVQHLQPDRPSQIARILARHTLLVVKEARHGEVTRNGTVYVAPPGRHLTVGIDRRLALSHLPPVHFCRPSGDKLFTSIAACCGAEAIAVVLTGTGCDGAEGAGIVHRQGGLVIAQDESSSEFFGMPSAAIRAGAVDRVLPLDDIAGVLETLVDGSGKGAA